VKKKRPFFRRWKRPLIRIVFGILCVAGMIIPLAAWIRIPHLLSSPAGTPGVPWTGSLGVSERVAQIAARQRLADTQPPRPYRVMPEHEIPHGPRGQDPSSPNVAQWPPEPQPPAPPRIAGGRHTPQFLGTSFTGATLSDTGAFPPDSMGAVGPSQFIVFVNGRIRSFNKTTGAADGVLNADPDTFFASVMTPIAPPIVLNFTSDPQVRYDRLTGRWILTIIDVPSAVAIGDKPNRLLVAVSDAASAGVISLSTVFTFYFVQQNTLGGGDSGELLDYDSLGVDAHALYVGGNMFVASTGGFSTTSGFVIRKSSILSGGPIVTTAFRGLITGGDGPDSPRGVDNFDPLSNEGYFIGPSDATSGRLVLRRIGTPGGTPTISANIAITVPTTAFPIDVDHAGNTGGAPGQLDAIDDRLFAAHVRNGRLWTAHNIAVDSTGTASSSDPNRRDGVRWYELNVPAGSGTPTVVQAGTIFDNAAAVGAARQFWMPSVMVSGQGHAALGFSTAGTPFHVDAATVGRLASDPLSTTETVEIYTMSSTAYNPRDVFNNPINRWGDYSFTSLDPLDDMTLWTIQEFCDNTNSYGVRVVKLIAPPPATPSSTDHPGGVAAGQSSVSVTVTGTSAAGSGFYDPGTNLASPALPFSHLTASVTGGITVNSITYNNPTSVTLSLNTTAASNGAKDLSVCNPDGQCTTGFGLLTIIGGPTPTPTPTPAPTRYFSITPCRIVDTRGPAGPLGGPALAAKAVRTFSIAGQCGIPSSAVAVSINVTVTQPSAAGDLRVFPGGTSLPLVSAINYQPGQTRANNAVAKVGAAGDLAVRCDQASGTVQLIIDANGYFQ